MQFDPRGRKEIPVDMEAALDLLSRGEKVPAIAKELGINQYTLRNRIADLQQKQGLLLQYREIQSLQLTELQARVLEAITPEKIEDANLRDLIASYKILKDKELVVEGKPSEIRGLVAHLIHLEKQEAACSVNHSIFEDDEEVLVEASTKDLVSQLMHLDDSEF
jgi:transposase-like protein